jgi:molybdopterin/thiamine biosynthesis adenylyltransferase
MGLSENEQKRYARQMMMEGWGEEIQRTIKRSTVFIAGAGDWDRLFPSISQ